MSPRGKNSAGVAAQLTVTFTCPAAGQTPSLNPSNGQNMFCNQVGVRDICPQKFVMNFSVIVLLRGLKKLNMCHSNHGIHFHNGTGSKFSQSAKLTVVFVTVLSVHSANRQQTRPGCWSAATRPLRRLRSAPTMASRSRLRLATPHATSLWAALSVIRGFSF